MNISYILPIKWDGDQPIAELTGYLTYLSPQMDLIIVDGSLPANFERHTAHGPVSENILNLMPIFDF